MTGRVTKGGKFFASSWKNMLNVVWKCWTWFKKFGSPSENSSPRLVSPTGYGPIHYQDSKQQNLSVVLSSGLPALTLLKSSHFWQFFLLWGWKHDTKINIIFSIKILSKLQYNFCVCILQWKLIQKIEHRQQCTKWKNSLVHLWNHNFAVHLNANVTVGSIFALPSCLGKSPKYTKLQFLQVSVQNSRQKVYSRGLYVCSGKLDILNLTQTPLI